MTVTAFEIAQRFIGTTEVAGVSSNAAVLAMLRLDDKAQKDDSTPWCSAFVNYIAWLLRLPRSKSLAARSWLTVGTPVELKDAVVGFDIVVLNRANGPTDPTKVGPGHVGFFGGVEDYSVWVLGGNQSDTISLARFPKVKVLGVRRLV